MAIELAYWVDRGTRPLRFAYARLAGREGISKTAGANSVRGGDGHVDADLLQNVMFSTGHWRKRPLCSTTTDVDNVGLVLSALHTALQIREAHVARA